MDQVLVDALSGIAVPAGVFVVGLIVGVVNRFTKDRIVANIKASAEALAALPVEGHSAAREALTEAIEIGARQLASRNRPGRLRWLIFIALYVIAIAAVVYVSWPIITSGSATTVLSYVAGVAAALATLGTAVSSYNRTQKAVKLLRDDLGDLDTDLAQIYRDKRDATP